ncbi:MAG: hypothetical protein R3345_12420 [Fulvivirga sp.]|nr:hypothetical protein [Fulvivirga sp.]
MNQLNVRNLQNEPLTVDEVFNETDTLYRLDLNALEETNLPDTVIFEYSNTIVDSARIEYGFQRDSDCCINPREIESIEMLNLAFSKLIRQEFDVYSIRVE